MWSLLEPCLKYTTTRYLVVDVWQIGLLHRLLQLAIVIYAIFEAISQGSWAFSEVPANSVNAYGSRTAAYESINAIRNLTDELVYCGNESYSYIMSKVCASSVRRRDSGWPLLPAVLPAHSKAR